MKSIFIFFLIAIALMIIPSHAAVMVGDKAPEIMLSDEMGESFSLNALEGSVVVLFFLGYS